MGKIIGEGITFDDVLLVPQYSEVTVSMPALIKGMLSVQRMVLSQTHFSYIQIIHYRKLMTLWASSESPEYL